MTTPSIDFSGLFSTVTSSVMQAIQAVLPLGLSIFGVMLSVSLGMWAFKKLTGKGSA